MLPSRSRLVGDVLDRRRLIAGAATMIVSLAPFPRALFQLHTVDSACRSRRRCRSGPSLLLCRSIAIAVLPSGARDDQLSLATAIGSSRRSTSARLDGSSTGCAGRRRGFELAGGFGGGDLARSSIDGRAGEPCVRAGPRRRGLEQLSGPFDRVALDDPSSAEQHRELSDRGSRRPCPVDSSTSRAP